MSAEIDTTAPTGAIDGRVRRALPGLGREWDVVAGQISRLLLDLADANSGHPALPRPLGSGDALHAWSRLQTVIGPVQRRVTDLAGRTVIARLSFVTIAEADIALLGATAHELARSHTPDGNPPLATAVARTAAVLARTPHHLIAQVARVHRVLDLDLGADGDILAEWGADGPMFVSPPYPVLAAHRRIAARVHTAWHTSPDRAPP